MAVPKVSELTDRQALLLVSFGGPEAPEEVVPFLQRVTAGRGIPEERLRVVGQHYFDRGGVSPINAQCRALIGELESAFSDRGIDMPIYWGNRNSAPFLDDTVAAMAADGITHAYAFVTSAYSSYSGCRQYRENIEAARQLTGPQAPVIDKLRVYFNHPGFVEPLADRLHAALGDPALEDPGLGDPSVSPERTHVFFTAHSIPSASAATCDYEQQVRDAAALVVERVPSVVSWSVAWQSRSGPPSMPWLEPDICDAIAALDRSAIDRVVVVPSGFVSDHMEVIQDLDTDAAAAADAAGLDFARVETSSTDPRFVDMVIELLTEQIASTVPVALGPLGLVPTQCSETCCPAPRRPVRPSTPEKQETPKTKR